jgi:hypothetical protein
MALFSVNNSKMIAMNETKTTGVIFEWPIGMGNGEILDRVNEFRAALLKSIEEAAKDTTEEKKDVKVEDQDKAREPVILKG